MNIPLPVLLTGTALAVLIVAFIAWFLAPAIALLRGLRRIQRSLKAKPQEIRPAALRKIFEVDKRLAHLWSEFAETLHQQTEERDGQRAVVAIRSTIPAESYFNGQNVVDSKLGTEFFKHLPGIFTGIGIIGTFSGLISGLRAFQNGLAVSQRDASSSATATNEAVRNLLHEVSTAFFVSAAAITAAMLVTFVEKLLLSSLYRITEEIAQDIDARFTAGAGEEYLSRIAHAAEDSASQAKILKDALVDDLRQLLGEVSHAQILASKEDNRTLATAISGSIADSLRQPLIEIAGTVKSASGDQSAAASRLLQDVLSSFSQRLNELFGGQIAGINELNKDTAGSIREVAKTLNILVANIESASAKSGDAMATRMAEAIEKMEQRQESINNQTTAFVEQLRQIVAASQSETDQKMREGMAALGTELKALVDSLQAASNQSLTANREREELIVQRTTGAVAAMTDSVESSIGEITEAGARMQEAVARIGSVTTTAIDRMNYGADTLRTASQDFAKAGDRVSSVMGQSATVLERLNQISGTMTSSSAALQETIADYRSHRDFIGGLVGDLRGVVESAKHEARITADVLERLQSAATKLSMAQTQADEYLAGVSRVLAESHQAFADATRTTLDRANTDFHVKLSSAVGLLGASIQELETTIASR